MQMESKKMKTGVGIVVQDPSTYHVPVFAALPASPNTHQMHDAAATFEPCSQGPGQMALDPASTWQACRLADGDPWGTSRTITTEQSQRDEVDLQCTAIELDRLPLCTQSVTRHRVEYSRLWTAFIVLLDSS